MYTNTDQANKMVILDTLALAAKQIKGAELRIATTGTPHIVIEDDDETFALYYYMKSRSYRLFWPWPSFHRAQRQKTFKSPFEVRRYFDGRV